LKDSATQVALTTFEGSSLGLPGVVEPRFGCWAMIATRRREFLAVLDRVGFLFAAEELFSSLPVSGDGR
jgi:hypothetical protein